jgi:hypothetical protein
MACGYPLRVRAYPTGYGGDKGPICRECSTIFSRPLLFEHREGVFEPSVWRIFPEVRAQDLVWLQFCALELPFQVPRILKDPQAPICACYDEWVFSWECRPRTKTRSSRRFHAAGFSRRGIMQIRIARTREDQEPGQRDCAICRDVFWLGEATAWAITDDSTLIGEVCPACLEGGASHIEAKLEERARLSRVIAEQDERFASESVEDVPSVDELLVAEAFYGGRG